jgi:putative PIN family toxin of toxin-antitoxin system
MSRAPRLVLDTNVVVSALIFTQGRVAVLRRAWHDGRCRPLASQATVAELIRALKYPKFKLSADEQRELLADYIPYCIAVRIPAKPPKTPACRDPFDVPFLQLALAGKADSLLTGDRDLLALADRFPCRIQTPGQWLEQACFSRRTEPGHG